MRILHLNELYPPMVLGGAERSVAMLAETQARAGHEVAVACTTPGAFAEERVAGVTVFRMPHETAFWSEDWVRQPPLKRAWRKVMMPFNRAMCRHFERVMDQARPDVVHTHSLNDVTTSAWTAAKGRGYPIVHTLRNYDLLCANGARYHGGDPCGLRCRGLSAAKRWQHRAIDAVVGISDEVLAVHLDHGLFGHVPQGRRHVIWNSARVGGAGAGYRKPDRSGKPFAFGFLGRLTQEKGIGVLIDAARALPDDCRWELVIAGREPGEANTYQGKAAGLPIRFLGQVDPLPFFEQIDVLVAPSIWAEPFGRIVVEAYSVGTPVIVADSGGMPGLVAGDQAAWIVPPGDVMALAKRMSQLIASGRPALPGRDTFAPILDCTDPDVIAARYAQVYADLIATRPRSMPGVSSLVQVDPCGY